MATGHPSALEAVLQVVLAEIVLQRGSDLHVAPVPVGVRSSPPTPRSASWRGLAAPVSG